ncbi:MAG: RidA family protein [Gemmatimonadaceae bacterium]|nr:RidA family protein [Gemmatimonadaceae bacterium]
MRHIIISAALAFSGLCPASLDAQVTRDSPPSLPPTGGRYTHVVTSEVPAGSRLVFIAGQVGADSTGRVVSSDAAAQMRAAYDNLDRALRAAGAMWTDVLKTTTILTRASDIAVLRDVRAARFAGMAAPANTLIVAQALYDPAVLFEVEAIAIIRPRSTP